MRSVVEQRSPLRYPLDSLLGSPASVRVLRVLLYEGDGPLGVSAVSRLAGISNEGARKALARLQQAGAVERIGTGRAQQYAVRTIGPVFVALRQLFEEEERRYDELVGQLKSVFAAVPEVRSAWISHLPQQEGLIDLIVVVDTASIAWANEELRARISSIEKGRNLIIETNLFTRADAPMPGPDAVQLWLAEPEATMRALQPVQTHAEAEERSLQAARAIAELVREDPFLLKRAKQHLNRQLSEGQGIAAADIAEWRQLLETYSAERVADLLVSDSSRAARLRQSSPFFAVLSSDERDRVYASMSPRR